MLQYILEFELKLYNNRINPTVQVPGSFSRGSSSVNLCDPLW